MLKLFMKKIIFISVAILIAQSIFAEQIPLSHLCSKLNQKKSKDEIHQFFNDKSILLKGNVPNEHLLFLLMDLFEQYKVDGPLVISFTDEVGPEKIAITRQKDRPNLVKVSRNADELLLGTSLDRIAKEVCRKKSSKRTFTIDYTNTVFEQFLRTFAKREILIDKLAKHTGLRFRSRPTEIGFSQEQEFRKEELITIYKQFVDIPRHVYKKMSLDKIVRYRMGYEIDANVAADYVHKYKRIRLSDAATMEGSDIFGEGTIIHEMGHAFNYGVSPTLMNEYFKISWTKGTHKWKLKREDSKGMISDYSMKNEKEDFAEHFSAFVHRPEALKQASMEKFLFFKYKIFKDTEYFTTAAKNAKVSINSDITDLNKPSLTDSLSRSVEVEKTGRATDQKVRVRITKARDDLSGIVETLISFTHVKNKRYTIFVKAKPVKVGNYYNLEGETKIDKTKVANGKYQLTLLKIEDGAGNKKFYKASPISEIDVAGDLSADQDDSKDLNFRRIKMSSLESNDNPRVEIILPTIHEENLDSIHLNWMINSLEEKTTHVINKFHSNIGDSSIKTIVRFYKQYPSGTVSLTSIVLRYKGTKYSGKRQERHLVPTGFSNTKVFINTPTKQFSLNTASLNRIKLTAKMRKNKKGGKHNIIVEIPMSNIVDSSTTTLGIKFRDPKGKQIYVYSSDSSRKRSEYEDSVDSNGNPVIKIVVPLKKFPVSGEYIFESIKVETKLRPRYNALEPIDLGKGLIKRYKLIERGIRKTFSISDDNKLRLN
jgi:hypothetical protein